MYNSFIQCYDDSVPAGGCQSRPKVKPIVEQLSDAGVKINCFHCQDNYSELHYTADRKWCWNVLTLLKKGADVQVKTKDGESALIPCEDDDHWHFLKIFFDAGADIVCSHCRCNYTVLLYDSKKKWPVLVQSLLKKGVDVETKSDFDVTPLLKAARNKHKDTVELLVNAGEGIESSNDWNYTALHYASEIGWFDIVQSLLEKGADVQVKTKHGFTPLLLAAKHRHRDNVELLINAGSAIDCTEGWHSYTVLHFASENGWLNIVLSLLEKGADMERKTGYGDTPLLLAAERKHKDIVDIFMNAGADVKHAGGEFEYTMLHYAALNGWLDVTQSLMENGPDAQAKSAEGNTALFLASSKKHKDIVELLLKDDPCDDSFNYKVLHRAVEWGWLEIVQSLVSKKVDLEQRSLSGKTPLQTALDHNQLEMVKFLISAGADVNVEDLDDNSIFTVLLGKSPDIDVVRLFLESGACLKLVDYKKIMCDPSLKEDILKNIELCTHAVINKFNCKDLPKLYELSVVRNFLPDVENMEIGKNSQVAQEVRESVSRDIEINGHCNVLEVRPKALKMICVKYLLGFYDIIKQRENPRSAEYDDDDYYDYNRLPRSFYEKYSYLKNIKVI